MVEKCLHRASEVPCRASRQVRASYACWPLATAPPPIGTTG